MKCKIVFFSICLIVSFIVLMGLTTSTAQALRPAALSLVSQPVPLWKQVNSDGFGDPYNQGIYGLEVFNDHLYVTSGNWKIGAQVWRLETDGSWISVSEPGFGTSYGIKNPAIPDLAAFSGNLYAGTAWAGIPGHVWRSSDGTSWDLVVNNGFGNPNNIGVAPFATYKGMIYAGTIFESNGVNGFEIWRSTTGDPGDWQKVVTGGKGNSYNYIATSFTEFGNYLYAAIENMHDGAEIWRTDNGITWTTVRSGGFGDGNNTQTGGMAIYDGYLYVGTRNDITGAQLFRSANGTTWDPVMDDGFGNLNNFKIEMIFALNGSLLVGADNSISGVEVWQSTDGLAWHQVNLDGFGDRHNVSVLWNSSSIENNHNLYIGALNSVTGGEIWQLYFGYPTFVPLANR